ncbi:MAG: phosphatidate cytidylyltransferase [bacterium]
MPIRKNTITRIVVSLLAAPIILFLCYFGKLPFLFFVSVLGLVSFYEFSIMAAKKSSHVNKLIGYIAVLAIILNSYYNFIEFEILVYITIVMLFLIELFRKKNSAIFNTGSTLAGIFYIGLFSSALIKIRELYNISSFIYDRGGLIIISLLLTIWVCDSAAFFIGSPFGKHKLYPRISPNKSWEGAIAGFVFSIFTVIALKSIILDFLSWQDIIIMGVVVGVFGQMGDLIESLIKRDANVKDSSSLIPGHGGLFDRFDSLLFTAPIIYLYFHLLVQI